MALVPIRIDRTSKPPIGTPLRSDGHWSMQGLVAIPLNEGGGYAAFSSHGDVGSVTTTGPGKITQSGWQNNGTFNNKIWFPNKFGDIATDVTLLIQATRFSNTDGMVVSRGTYDIDDGYYLQFGFSGDVQFVTGRHTVVSYSSMVPVGVPCVISARKEGPQGSIFLNGSKQLLAINENLSIGPTYRSFLIGDYDFPGFSLDGSINFVLIYDYALFDTQIASLSANPWQIYEPETVWVEVGGAFSFAGVCASSQPLQISYASGELRFDGNLVQAQPTQFAALSSVLAFVASAGQSQAAQSEIAAALLSFQGRIYQSQGEQMQAASDLVAKINAILRATSSDPLALTISVRDPLALRVTVH